MPTTIMFKAADNGSGKTVKVETCPLENMSSTEEQMAKKTTTEHLENTNAYLMQTRTDVDASRMGDDLNLQTNTEQELTSLKEETYEQIATNNFENRNKYPSPPTVTEVKDNEGESKICEKAETHPYRRSTPLEEGNLNKVFTENCENNDDLPSHSNNAVALDSTEIDVMVKLDKTFDKETPSFKEGSYKPENPGNMDITDAQHSLPTFINDHRTVKMEEIISGESSSQKINPTVMSDNLGSPRVQHLPSNFTQQQNAFEVANDITKEPASLKKNGDQQETPGKIGSSSTEQPSRPEIVENPEQDTDKPPLEQNDFFFEIEKELWQTIAPETKTYANGRIVRKMKKDWTRVFSEKCSAVYAGCVLAFKSHTVKCENSRISSADAIRAIAHCKGQLCTGKFTFRMTSIFVNESALVLCNVAGGINHSSEEINRRNVTGARRAHLMAHMKNATEQFYENLVTTDKRQMELGNFTGVPTPGTLRKIISEEIQKESLHTDNIRGLQLLKESYEASGEPYIREISVDPFTIIMIAEEQINFMKNRHLSLYIDATGSVISKVYGQKRPFLYSVVAKPDTSLPEVSLANMITTQHNIPKLEYFLGVMKREVSMKGGTLDVTKVESDFSYAMIQACLKTFNTCNLKQYLNICMDILKNKRSSQEITVHHLCSAHMTQDFIRSLKKECPKVNRSTRELATKLFALLQNTTSLLEAKTVYTHMCHIFLSQYHSEEVSKALESTEAEQKGSPLESEADDLEEDPDINITVMEDQDLEGKTIKQSSPFTDVFLAVKNEVENVISQSNSIVTHNSFYNQDIAACYDKFMPTFPLWSGLMLSYNRFTQFQETRDSNSPAEVWFKVLKHNIGLNRPCRPERFVIALRKLVLGRLTELKFPQARRTQKKRKTTFDQNMDIKEEKWRKGKSNKRQPKYHPPKRAKKEITPQKDRPEVIPQELPAVMSWGGKTHNVVLNNTCTIDNGLTILHLAFKQNKQFQLAVNEDGSQLCKTLLSIFRLMDEKNFDEAKLIWVNFTNQASIQPKVKTMQANLFGDESDFFMYALDQYWTSQQHSRCTSTMCDNPYKESRIEHGIHISLSRPVKTVQAMIELWMETTSLCAAANPPALDETKEGKDCVCPGEVRSVRTIVQSSPIAAVRVYEHCMYQRLTLADILSSKNIVLNSRTYSLAGVTMFRHSHYTAIVHYRGDFLWFDGLMGSLRPLPQSIQEWFPSHILYIAT